MSIEGEIYDRLAASLGTTVQAIYDTIRPQGQTLGEKPVVVFQRVVGSPIELVNGDIALREQTYQVNVFCARGYVLNGRSVRDAVITALQNYRVGSFKAFHYRTDLQIAPTDDIDEFQFPIEFKIDT